MKFKDTEYGDLTEKVYEGNISVSFMKLESLEGAPKEVQGNFNCSSNKLENLKYSPEIVNGNFICNYNANLKSLEYAPKIPLSFKGLYNVDKSKTPHLFI